MSQATTKRLEDEKAQLEREVALLKSSPAPQGWEKDYSRKQKKVWYRNATTRHTQWHAPTEEDIANPEAAAQLARKNEERERQRMC